MEDYSIDCSLLAEYSKENIFLILKKGSEIGCIYYDFILGEQYENSPILTPYQAVEKVLRGQPDEIDFHCIFVRYNDTNFHLFFRSNNNYLNIHSSSFSYIWEKSFTHNHYHIDLARYIRLTLNLVADFKIIELTTNFIR